MAYEAFFALAGALAGNVPSYCDDQRKASVAAIFRIVPLGSSVSLKGVNRGDIAAVKRAFDLHLPSGPLEVQLLFIKRSESPRDRHSGQVALPGGKLEPGETPLQAAVRETK